MRNWWKRSLVLCLTLLMTLTPWAASWAERTTATGRITATVQLDAEGLAEAIRLVEPGWDEEDQQLLACLTALANAARLEYVYAQDGSWIRPQGGQIRRRRIGPHYSEALMKAKAFGSRMPHPRYISPRR